jgi:predicted nucleic acid-binding protein
MIIADTGFWLALANRRDRCHSVARDTLGRIDEPLITTWPVLTETCHLLLSRLGSHAMQTFVRSLEAGALTTFDLKPGDAARVRELMETYANLPMDLADASLVILAEHLGHGRILSTDERDFNAYRWKRRLPFQNLLLE